SEYCLMAGEKAENSFAVEQALQFYNDALDALLRLEGASIADKKLGTKEKIADMKMLMGEYDQAIGHYIDVKEETSNIENKARMCRKIAQAHHDHGKFDLCIKAAEEGRNILDGTKTAELGRLMYIEGYGHLRRDDYDSSLSLFRDMKDMFEEIGQKNSDLGNAFRAMGNILWHRGQYDDALFQYEKSMEIMDSVGNKWGVAMAVNNIGLVCRRKELEKALGCYKQGLDLLEEIRNKWGIAVSLGNIGEIYFIMGNLDKALEYSERGLDISMRMGDKWNAGIALGTIADIKLQRGDLDGAQEIYEKNLAEYLEIEGKRGVIYSLCGLAETKNRRQDYQVALHDVEEALRIALEICAKLEQGVGFRIRGIVRRDMGDLESSLADFKKAESISQEAGSVETLAQAMYEHGVLLQKMGRPEEARALLEQALEEFSQMGMKLWAEKCLAAIAQADI
ncbi:MAG: tetratricopeptide repeat protein, partial [Candidatus Thermoplasmatota archaeon]|nr:tetratricopeptide repeat protein [Candidatus Thermoplasmatota archaeon]